MGKKKKIAISDEAILQRYQDPDAAGSLGGVVRFAKAQGIPVSRARRLLQKNLSYTLHKPRRVRFPTEKVMAQGMDHQWVADLVEMQKISRYNKGYKYLLTVVDVLSKHGWVQPVKAKTEVELVKAFDSHFEKSTKTRSASNGSRQRILQSNVSIFFEKEQHSSFFDAWRCQSVRGGTFQSNLETAHVSLFHGCQHASL